MNVGLIGTGAIARLHAQAYAQIGYRVVVVTDVDEDAGRRFAAAHGAAFVSDYLRVCAWPDLHYVDVCTVPNFRLDPVRACAAAGRHVQVQKPMATRVDTARAMIEEARAAGILLGIVSQHRFDTSAQFLASAIAAGRLGRLLQCDAYVKWHRSELYYRRPGKGAWAVEGGGALINQAIHQVDLLCWFAGPVREVAAMWQLGAVHPIESEDVLSAVLRFENGATGVIQASTACWPGYAERIEIHGTKGTAIITGDALTTWDVQDDSGSAPPLAERAASGAADPLAISLAPFERQFLDFGAAIREGRRPLVAGEDGLRALTVVESIYESCRRGIRVSPWRQSL